MLGSDQFGVLLLCEGFVDVSGHVAIIVSLCLVSGELYSAKQQTRHFGCNGVMFLQCVNEVVHYVHFGNFYAKVIHH
jgi:hypothetical protein